MTAVTKPLIFACTDDCAQATAWDMGLVFGEYTKVYGAEDVVGARVEDIELGMCAHRWRPAVYTAYKHVEACIFEYGLTHELGD